MMMKIDADCSGSRLLCRRSGAGEQGRRGDSAKHLEKISTRRHPAFNIDGIHGVS
jgi:hypothetical protein